MAFVSTPFSLDALFLTAVPRHTVDLNPLQIESQILIISENNFWLQLNITITTAAANIYMTLPKCQALPKALDVY